jgi:hypothetical protein
LYLSSTEIDAQAQYVAVEIEFDGVPASRRHDL